MRVLVIGGGSGDALLLALVVVLLTGDADWLATGGDAAGNNRL
ncbi:hypothetical protein [Rouxiella aceris]|nr:hypothetical protein [Rouxiella aceris]